MKAQTRCMGTVPDIAAAAEAAGTTPDTIRCRSLVAAGPDRAPEVVR